MTNHAAAIVTLILFLATSLAAEEHPFARAKVGDWAWYTTTETSKSLTLPQLPPNAPASVRRSLDEMARKNETSTKEPTEARFQVSRKTDTQVVVTTINREFGRDYESAWTIDLTASYQPFPKLEAPNQPLPKAESPVRELGRGTEVLTLKGNRYETTWIEYEVEYASRVGAVTERKKIWRSPTVPIDGMVKMERSYTSGALTRVTVTELTMFGQDGTSAQ